MNRNDFVAAYIEAALFADTPEDAPAGAELNAGSRLKLELTAGTFYDAHTSAIEMYAASSHGSNAGHDLWYTQNGHGCGYWEHESFASARYLDAAANELTQIDIYVGDNGEIYAD